MAVNMNPSSVNARSESFSEEEACEVTEEVKGGWKVERDEGRRTNNESENRSQPNWRAEVWA